MKSTGGSIRGLSINRIMMLLPALGLGCLIGSPCWGQADPVTAGPTKPAVTAPAGSQADATELILTTPSESKSPPSTAAASTGIGGAYPSASEVSRMNVEIEQLGDRLALLTKAQQEKWQEATAALPGFCEDWDRMLHDREVNNLSHLAWQEKQGYETASYTGYGKVQDCQAKESDEGVPIGKVTYLEVSYYLSGKSIDDAKAHPQVVSKISTLEIFSFEKDKWFY